ncbi:MAG: hypothetical protein KC496_07595 [Anaerolineae bacterium]|nr:hypothetical protein [Anaerolineae bacterium]
MTYPEQRLISRAMRLRRKVMLPEESIGQIEVKPNQMVDIRDRVARGIIPANYRVIEAQQILRLRKPEQLDELMLKNVRDRVQAGDVIAGKDPERGRRVMSPVMGVIVFVGDGRIVVQEAPQVVSLEAGVSGRVTQVLQRRGVIIESSGALIQGVWGNGRNVVAVLRMAPDAGIETISEDTLDTTYKGEIVVTRHPLTERALRVADIRGFDGIIAPSISADLLGLVEALDIPVMLTAGFGNILMSSSTLAILSELDGRQAALDAAALGRYGNRRPQVVITRPVREEDVSAESGLVALRKGMRVRITREPYFGTVGTVIDLPQQPQRLANGLVVPCALVDVLEPQHVLIPLVNIELAGA